MSYADTPSSNTPSLVPFRDQITAFYKLDLMDKLNESLGNSENALQLAKQVVLEAKKQKIPTHFLIKKNEYHWQGTTNVLQAFMQSYQHQKAARYLIKEGLNPWMFSFDANNNVIHENTSDLLENIFPLSKYSTSSLSLRKLLLEASLQGFEHYSTDLLTSYLTNLPIVFQSTANAVSLTRAGVLSWEDKIAKESSDILLEFQDKILSLAQSHPKQLPALAAMFEVAQKIKTIKSDDQNQIFDPEKLKKSLTKEQKERLRTLSILSDQCSGDSEAFSAVLETSAWLKENPQILCLNLRSGYSFFFNAICNHNIHSLELLETLQANVWLAAAQQGESNAVLWMTQTLNSWHARKHSDKQVDVIPVLSRLLAYGAFLDGASDPVDYAVKKSEEARQKITDYSYSSVELDKTLVMIKTQLESIVFEEVLKKIPAKTSEPSATPTKRRL